MILTEPIESINQQLIDHFGIETDSSRAMWRVVFSEDQYEKYRSDVTPSGVQLLHSVVMTRPKYKQWIHRKYVLERLVAVPESQVEELAGIKTSYEPIWVFEDRNGNYLPPTFWAAKFVVDNVYASMGKKSLRKYIDEEAANPQEEKEKRIKQYEEMLFGDESSLLLRTVTGEAIVVPQSYKATQTKE